jgi:speckle-type POZ protein
MTQHVTATVNFEITNYLRLKGMSVGEFVSSPVFRVAGYDWEIRFYPAGKKDFSAGKASCFVRYLSQGKDVWTSFALSMLETKGQEQVAGFGTMHHVFSPRKDERGHEKFVDRSKLKSVSRQGDGCFTIRCVLTVSKESPPLELAGHLERMLRNGRGADVTFCVRGQKFGADRSLLAARSPFFGAQLFGPMAEKDMRHVEVVDMEPAIFQMMLHYIYTESLPPGSGDGEGDNTAVMQHLLVAADRYGVDTLKQICEEELCNPMEAESVSSTLALANQHQCERLKKACMAFMESAEVMGAAVETDGFKEHLKTCSRPLSLEEPRGEKATINPQDIMIQARDMKGYVRK